MNAPYYRDDYVTVYHGDFRDYLDGLDLAGAVVVTDPPFNETSLEWDIWPKSWPDRMLPFAKQLWCCGSMRMFWNYRTEFSGWTLAQDLIWEKHNGSGMCADRFRRVHELVLHFYQGDWDSLFHEPPIVTVAEERNRQTLIRGRKPAHWGGVDVGNGYDYNGERIMRSVIPARSCHGYAVNETQKPEAVIAPILQYSVPPGGLVFDPFAGSGTVGAVAKAQGKRAILIEKRESQCFEIKQRLLQAVLQLA